MKKIPTLFKRGPSRLVVNEITPGCEWVIQGRGEATQKWDGSACLIQGGKLYKRITTHGGKIPPGFITAEPADPITGAIIGWLPVGDGPEDKYHREASIAGLYDGTYELVGPMVQGNPHRIFPHILIPHGRHPLHLAPRDFEGLADYLRGLEAEGIVFHSGDGRMAKIKRRDFGLPWGARDA